MDPDARFAQELDRHSLNGTLGLAVSGGPDSMAMLALAMQSKRPIAVASVDHGLRAESADECAMVADFCERNAIPCAVLSVTLERGNIQSAARRARYDALYDWCRDGRHGALLTAHHADDQAETLLMRLNRGSGLGGLAGIRALSRTGAVPLVRPLLSFRRQELRAIVADAGLPFVDDPSNTDTRYDRVRIREAMAGAGWIDAGAFARSAALLAESNALLDDMAGRLWDAESSLHENTAKVPVSRYDPINVRNLLRAVARFGGLPGHGDMHRLVAKLTAIGGKANIGGVLIERQEHAFLCTPEPPRGG